MKKAIFYIWALLGFVGFWFAQVARFEVEVDPNPTVVNAANDVIIKAVDEDGNVVEDYNGEALLMIYDEQGNDITDQFDVLPWDGIIEFDLEDQWVKRYSKALIFPNPWVYEVVVEDAIDDTIRWSTTVTVNEQEKDQQNQDINIQILSPIDWSQETKLPIEVVANTSMPNTIYRIFIDDNQVSVWITDENWQINDVIEQLSVWTHKLQIKLYDANDEQIAQSEIITFSYQPPSEDIFEKIEIQPSNTIYEGEKVNIIVYTKTKADDVVLSITDQNGQIVTNQKMEYREENKYVSSVTFTKPWQYNVSVKITNNGQTKEYNNTAQIQVKKLPKIYNVQITKDEQNWSVMLKWEYEWDVASFKIKYWTDNQNLNFEKIVSQPEAKIEWLDITKTYYFQIYPLNEFGQVIWQPSDVIMVNFWKAAPETCNVQNISLRVENINWKNYLVWDKVDWVVEYHIYKAEDVNGKPGEFVKVGQTTDTKWEYPFDKNAQKDIYAYFKVVGICQDNREYQIWNIVKVKVWPWNTIALILLMFIFLYSIYYVYFRLK